MSKENRYLSTLRLKVRSESYNWLSHAAYEVNQVWNWANATSIDALDRIRRSNTKFLSGFDLCNLSAGSSEYFNHIKSDTIQRICCEYANKRKAAKRVKLRWRKSGGSHRSLGWIPFKAINLKRRGVCLRFAGKSFRVFEHNKLENIKWRDGEFAQDSVGDWWLCLPVIIDPDKSVAPKEAVGIDLGLKDIAVTSNGEKLVAGRWTQRNAERLASAQRRSHKKQTKLIHRKIARCRLDTIHKFSRRIIDSYQSVFIGNISSLKLAKTKMAKSVLDSGWGLLKTQLQYKGQWSGRSVEIVDERNTSRGCSQCGSLSGPQGLRQLAVRQWRCMDCSTIHDRDINAAKNILSVGLRQQASVSGNESLIGGNTQ